MSTAAPPAVAPHPFNVVAFPIVRVVIDENARVPDTDNLLHESAVQEVVWPLRPTIDDVGHLSTLTMTNVPFARTDLLSSNFSREFGPKWHPVGRLCAADSPAKPAAFRTKPSAIREIQAANAAIQSNSTNWPSTSSASIWAAAAAPVAKCEACFLPLQPNQAKCTVCGHVVADSTYMDVSTEPSLVVEPVATEIGATTFNENARVASPFTFGTPATTSLEEQTARAASPFAFGTTTTSLEEQFAINKEQFTLSPAVTTPTPTTRTRITSTTLRRSTRSRRQTRAFP